MTILSAKQIRRSIGAREILAGISLNIDASERVGMVGRNGCGKSTLAKILAGIEDPDSGEVVYARGTQVMLLEQEPQYPPGISALDAVLAGKTAWIEAIAEHEAVCVLLENLDPGQSDQTDALLKRQSTAAATVEKHGGWDLRHEARAMLGHLGIPEHDRALDNMSGGQRRRVALARIFVAAPDLAILDEPTNHLDVSAIEWLEEYLVNSYPGAVLLVTHDRQLLDQVVSRTLEIENANLYSYDGGWGQYLLAKAEREAHAARAESNRQNYLRRELEWLAKRPRARTTKSKSRIDAINSVVAIDAPTRMGVAGLTLESSRSGRTVLDVEGLRLSRDGRCLIEHLDLYMMKSQRLGIIGPNGCGKTSLIKCLLGELAADSGELRLGKNADIAYLDQSRSGLDPNKSVYDMVAEGRTQIELGGQQMSVRQYLERMLFDVHAQRQAVGSLSGGERGRVALARILREPANLVILDEPTNDLDVDTLSALEGALVDFGGTLIAVTHDRWFLDRVMTNLLVFEGDGRTHLQTGNYTAYREFREAHPLEARAVARVSPTPQAAVGEPAAAAPVKPASSLSFTERHELEGMMPRIEAAEQAIEALEAALDAPGFYQQTVREQQAHHAKLTDARGQLEALVERWELLESKG